MIKTIILPILFVFSIYFLYRTLIQISGVKSSLNYINKTINLSNKTNKKLILLIPVYNESEIIKESLNYFKKIIKNTNIKIYFITTKKEGNLSTNKTYKTIKEYLGKDIKNIYYPYEEGAKAHQLNYAIKKISKNLKDLKSYYIGVFDCDSRPDKKGLQYVLSDNESPIGYQMFSIYSTNYNEISPLNKANALFQSRWSLSFELPRTLINYSKKHIKRLMYFIGHGIFLRFDELVKNNFPEDSLTEDLSLGYDFAFRNKPWKVIPFFDYCSVPQKFSVNIIQSSRWFYGELCIFKNYLKNVRNYGFNFRNLFLMFERYTLISQWMWGAQIILIMIILSLLLGSYILLAINVISTFLYIVVLHRKLKAFFKINYRIYFFLLLKCILNFIGPTYGFFRLILSSLNLKKYEFIKTER